MAKNIKIKPSNFVGVNTSSRKTFGLKTNLTIQPSKLLTLRKALAFTLAEVLVVLGIIGVVSALTLPNLGQNKSGCFTNKSPKNFRGAATETIWNLNTNDSKRYILADGTSVYFHVWNKTCNGYNAPDGSKSGCGLIEVDLDGPNKGPHQAGKDIFLFDISDTYGIYPFGSFQVAYDLDAIYKKCFNTGNGCAAWVINNGNLDYLKADANGKCPNGKVLSQTVTTCK